MVHWVDRLERSHILHIIPFHVTRHVAIWTNSDFGSFETWCDDCDHCPDDWKRLTEEAERWLSESSSGRDGGGDVTGCNVGINAEVLSSSS